MWPSVYLWSIKIDRAHLAEIERKLWVWKKHFIPRGRARNRVTEVFNKIRRPARRVKWKYARSAERFCGRGEVCLVSQTGVRLDNDGIHPSIFHHAEVGTLCECEGREGERKRVMRKNFFLPLFPSTSLSLYRNQKDAKRISNSREICQQELFEENFPQERQFSIAKSSSEYS